MVDAGTLYPRLVKEFIVNLSKGFNDANSFKYSEVYVHGYCFGFSPTIINEYLGREKLTTIDRVPSINITTKEINANTHDD